MTSLRDVLKQAAADKIAVGHFNFSDLVAFNAIVAAARDRKLPVMVGVSEGEREFTGVRQAAALVKAIRDEYDYPIFLNADHTHSIAKAEAAAKAGFDEVIFDGSALAFEENIKQTIKAIEAIKSINPAILVEGEIGWIGSSSAVIDRVPAGVGVLTTPAEAKQFVDATKVDVLAPAVGNMHGMLESMVHGNVQKHLNIERIARDQGGGWDLHDAARRIRHQRRRFQARNQGGHDDRARQHRNPDRVAPWSRSRSGGGAERSGALQDSGTRGRGCGKSGK